MALPSQNNDGIATGQLRPSDTWGEYNNLNFVIQQQLQKMQTATLVRIEACTNDGGVTPVGFVDVTPMVNQIDGQGNAVPHATIYGIPYFRLQGGTNAIIIDPEPGDIGMCVFASRDISKIKSTKKSGNPGSFRAFNYADGMYLGGLLNAEPIQYVQFTGGWIKMVSPNKIWLEAPEVVIDAETVVINATTSTTITTPQFKVIGASEFQGGITQSGGASSFGSPVTVQGTNVHTHTHSGVTPGGGTSGPPV